jgi:dsRNA-specific ribonuclease
MVETDIFTGERGDEFERHIRHLLELGRIKPKYIDALTTVSAMAEYAKAFTAQTAHPTDNYERYEHIGDVTINKFIVWYAYRRFPQLECCEGVKVVARLRINYGAKEFLGGLAETHGFWPFISAANTGIERNVYYRSRNRVDLLEDCMEAFIGCTEYLIDRLFRPGAGYAIVYDILKTMYDAIDISLAYDALYDAKTRLKETFDMFKGAIGTWRFNEEHISVNGQRKIHSCLYQVTIDKRHVLIGDGVGYKKTDAQQIAAARGLEYMRQCGVFKHPPRIYRVFENPPAQVRTDT